jgi:hypothetical protein
MHCVGLCTSQLAKSTAERRETCIGVASSLTFVISLFAAMEELVPFPHLVDGDVYNPNTFEYLSKAELESRGLPLYPSLDDWMLIFRNSIDDFQALAEQDPTVPPSQRKTFGGKAAQDVGRVKAAQQFADSYHKALDALEAGNSGERPACLILCKLREECLRMAGFKDVFLGWVISCLEKGRQDEGGVSRNPTSSMQHAHAPFPPSMPC